MLKILTVVEVKHLKLGILYKELTFHVLFVSRGISKMFENGYGLMIFVTNHVDTGVLFHRNTESF